MRRRLSWNNIEDLKEHHISYLLYREGKSIDTISVIRRMKKDKVQRHIIKAKMEVNANRKKRPDKLVDIMSMPKDRRIKYLKSMDRKDKRRLATQIYKRYVSFKNYEDRMILIWLIGELKDERLLPLLRMELSSHNGNLRRLSCSALGKINNKGTKKWLEDALYDKSPQVRQYSAKALAGIGDEASIKLLKGLLKDEKEYVRRAARSSIEEINKSLC